MDYQALINQQSAFFNTNKTKELNFRIGQLKKLKSIIKQSEPALYKAIYDDFRKSEFETYMTELSLVYHDIDEIIKKLPKWAEWKRVRTNLTNMPAKSLIIPEPLGVCLVMGAWNYPYQLSLAPVVAAIAAGNTVILKPSEIPSSTSAIMAKLINDAFPAEYLHVVEGGVDETAELLKVKFDKIFFTGSTTVGKIVYKAAAENLTPVTLELGGKSPAIVTKGVNLKVAAKRMVWAKFLNSGQTCIAPDYILVEQSEEEELLTHLKEHIKQNAYSFENGNYVQIINEKNFKRLDSLIDDSKVYSGGKRDAANRYIEPTIIQNVTFDDAIMQEEIFGPLLPVITYTNLDDVIQKIKARPKPLSCYIFTDDDKIKDKILTEISFGGGAVNDALMHITNSNLPFGGVGNSGIGSYHGEAGFSTFSHYKSVLEKSFWLEPPLKYPPYSKTKLSWIKRIMG